MEFFNEENARRVRAEVLAEMSKKPASCKLFMRMEQKIEKESDAATDYGMATSRLLATIHTPHCRSAKHLKEIEQLWTLKLDDD